jgi:beta-aspartyl-dipeptidase (metallo-type)
MVIAIENGEVFDPAPIGRADVLLIDNTIQKIGVIDREAIARLELQTEVVDATDGFVIPGFIDPHQHLLGGSGEEGFSSQTPEIQLSEIVAAGITTVVGCLGVDTTMKTMAGLLARAKALNEEGLTARIWSGGYNVPPTTITESIRDDIMFIEEVIGAGEVAISDARSTDPTVHELARLTNDAYVGGKLSRKCGVTQFHVGESDNGLKLLRQLLDEFQTPPESLYATHTQRNEKLLREAIELADRDCFVDIDVAAEDLMKWLTFYFHNGGDGKQVTISSDASLTSPSNILEQLRECTKSRELPLQRVLPLLTSNTARVLKMKNKGKLEAGMAADVVVLDRDSLQLREVIARGRRKVKAGKVLVKEAFLSESNRRIRLEGEKNSANGGRS